MGFAFPPCVENGTITILIVLCAEQQQITAATVFVRWPFTSPQTIDHPWPVSMMDHEEEFRGSANLHQ